MTSQQSKITFFACSIIFLIFAPIVAVGQDNERSPIQLARGGSYSEAAVDLEKMVREGNTSPGVVESFYYCWIRMGKYKEASSHFEKLAIAYPEADSIILAAGRSKHLTGNPQLALTYLNKILDSREVGIAARYEKAIVLEAIGRRDESRKIYTGLIENFQAGNRTDIGSLIYIAKAMQELQYFYDANDTFKLAIQADSMNANAFTAWGDLLAEKYNYPEALASYEDALKIDPNMPEAHLGIARVLVEENPSRSLESLQKALAVNPNYIEANLFVAEQLIATEEYLKADQETEKVLQINARSSKALALMATTRFTRGDKNGYKKYVQKVLESNPLYGEMYYILADRSVSLRLYKEAVKFAREAVRLNPNHWNALSLMGINLLRIAEEEEGKEVLEKAYKGDPFNVWTANTLTLLDSFSKFDRFDSENFTIRLHREERKVLAPYVTDLLEKAYRELTSKYEFKPEGPIIFEMFPDHADFAVRALGLPGLGAFGVCFGKVIVMDSPSARPPDTFNWGSTLWHEFAHVITLQITDHRIPRWFSEGISVYEERGAVTGWGAQLRLDYLQAIKEDRLLPIAQLNNGFVRPKNPAQVSLSYYQASLICDYLEEKYGFKIILRMLDLYKNGGSTVEVFQEALGFELSEFDADFSQWIDAKVDSIDLDQFRDLVLTGQQAFERGDIDEAIGILDEAVILYPQYTEEQNAYEILVKAHLQKGNKYGAIRILQEFTSYSDSAYKTYLKLASLLNEARDTGAARAVLKRALFINPMALEVHRELGGIFLKDSHFKEAVREYEILLALNVPDLANTYFNLASAQYGAGSLSEARRNVLRCLEIAPSFEAAQDLLLKIVR